MNPEGKEEEDFEGRASYRKGQIYRFFVYLLKIFNSILFVDSVGVQMK